jgi:WD40 repeat protein
VLEIVHACMSLRDRLPAAVASRAAAADRPEVAIVEPRSGPLTAATRAGELYEVPPLPVGFVARDELNELRATVLDTGSGAIGITGRAVGLHGQGGIGKSVLAAALARDPMVRRHFCDGVYWVTVGQHGDLVSTQRRLLDRLGVAHGELRSAAQGSALLAEALSDLRCLLVVDDIWSTAAGAAFRSIGPLGRVLYTTRDPNVLEGVGADVQRVGGLPDRAARELLVAVSGAPLDAWPEEIDRILMATGCVALALALAGATIRRGGQTWRDVAGELERAGETFLDHPYADTFKAMQVGVGALDERLAAAYGSLAAFPEDTRVPVAAVMRLWSSVHALSERATRAELKVLAARALLSLDGDAIAFHDLQREFLLLQTRNLSLLHDDLLRAYRALLPSPESPWRQLPCDEPYIWSHLLYHLQGAGDRQGLRAVASDLGFLAVRCFRSGSWGCESDLRTAQTAHADDAAIAWLLRMFYRWGFLFVGHGTVEELAATLAAQTDGAPAGIDIGALLGELLPDVALLAHRRHDAPDTLVRTLLSHARSVRGVVYAPSGDQLAIGCDDATVRLWDPATGQQIAVLEGHTRGVEYLAYAPAGDQLASASVDGTVRLWDPAAGKQVALLEGHTGVVKEVAYSPFGDQLVSGGSDGTVRLWDVATGEQITALEGHTGRVWAVAWAPSGNQVASAGIDGTVRLWNPGTTKQIAVLEGHIGDPVSVNYAPSGDQLASGGSDGTVRLWNPTTGEQIATFQGESRVSAMAWAPSGEQLAAVGPDGLVRLWDTATGEQGMLEGHTGATVGVAYTPSGDQIASTGTDGMVRLWDLATGKQIAALEGHTGWVRVSTCAPSGEQLASAGTDGTVRLWDLATGHEIAVLEGHSGWVRAIAYAPSGKQLATAGTDGTIRLWDTNQRRQTRNLLGGPRRRRPAAILTGHTGEARTVAFSPDGRLIVSGDSYGSVRLWNPSGTSVCCARIAGTIAALVWNSDGITIATDGNIIQLELIERVFTA